MKRRVLAGLLTCVMLFGLLPATALADGYEAKNGETAYETLDEAIKEAKDGDTIELLTDAQVTKTFYKSLTFTGGHTMDLNVYGWRYDGDLVFDGANLNIHTDADSPAADNGEAARWVTMVLGGSISARNGAAVTFTFDSAGGTNCAIYAGKGGVSLNVEDHSAFRIYGKNTGGVPGQGIQLDSTANTGIFVTGESEFLIDGANRGYVNSPTTYVENSTFTVQNCTANGSNGGEFTAINAKVEYLNNRGHGLSAGNVVFQDSVFNGINNGYTGLHVQGTFDASTTGTGKYATELTLTGNTWNAFKADSFAALRLTGNANIGEDVTVNIADNYGVGLRCDSAGASYVFDEGSDLTIVRNGKALETDGVQYNTTGGGIWNKGTLVIPSDAVIYNNHAVAAGDDIYNEAGAAITFGRIGEDWSLDGVPAHCDDPIDGWYDDPAGSRWEAHDEDSLYVDEFTGFGKDGLAAIRNQKALKAAHGLLPEPEPTPVVPEWDVSKSKTATNLVKDGEGNYTSDVTLSLPSAQEQLVSDVVLVLDKSTSADVEDQALAMLSSLKERLDATSAKIQVGVVIFNKEAHVANGGKFFDLSKEYEAIEEAIRQEIKSGTNTHAGLLAGKAMLDDDTQVDNSRKYLIFVSDAITYMYGAEPTVTAWTFWADGWKNWTGPDNWNSKYGTNDAPGNWGDWLTGIGEKVAAQGTKYEYPYEGTVSEATPQEDWQTAYANSIDKALYLTNQVYQAARAKGYHCYAMTASQNRGTQYLWGPSFMDYLAGGEEVSFEAIQNDIYYLVSGGSEVVDVIGKGTYGTTDRFAYDFDFVNDPDSLTLKVNGKELEVTSLTESVPSDSDPWETARYGFKEKDSTGDDLYILHYYENGRDGQSDECFVWEINVPITNFEQVQLTYKVRLTNPQLEVGVYGTYDEDGLDENGEQLAGSEFLFTNKSATLYPVDSNGREVQPEDFSRPAVSYEVKNEPTGTLYVTKYVLDSQADQNQTFSFLVTAGDAEQAFELRAGETKAISGLPVGAAYTVLETDSHGYTANYLNSTGTITGSGSGDTAVVVNVPEGEGALVISKTVNGGSTAQEFTFTVNLTGADGAYAYTGSKTGTIKSGETVTLKNGESIAINNLPAGAGYQITEKAAANYKTAISGNDALMAGTVSGSTASGTVVGGSAAVAHYTNTYTGGGSSGGGGGGSSGGGSKPDTVLNTDDHYSYIIGYKDGMLRPYGTITRGEVATIFFRMLTDETREKYWCQTNSYADCDSDLWCNNAISTLTNMGIIDGYQDGLFRPYGKITRAQFAKIAVGFFETTKEEYKGYFTDVPEDAWYTSYVEAAARVGLVQGFDNDTFQPDTNITRAQACVIVNRALDRKPQKDHLLPQSKMVTWPDCEPGDWFYADMQEATNSHDYKWLTSGSDKKYLEEWTEKLPQRDWAAFEHAWATAHSAPGGEVVK